MDTSVTTTSLNRRWVLKMAFFIVALLVLGLWGTADAFWIYPAKGRAHTQFVLKAYLEQLDERGLLLREASVEDPAATLKTLSASTNLGESPVDKARREWLESLSRTENLRAIAEQNRAEMARRAAEPGSPANATPTLFPDPRASLTDLDARLANQPQPTGLRAYDIPLQYVFMAIGFGGALWMAGFLASCAGKKFRFDHDEARLTLPDGRSFSASQIKSVDKRDWHKFFIHFTIEGFDRELKLDLLRFTPLEAWALDMERRHPNYEPPAPEPAQPVTEGAPAQPEQAASGERHA